MSVRFSILIPAYKSSFLAECIDSLLSQSFKDFEIIIVNDASPDNIDGIISKYDDSRIHFYVNEKNCGAENVVDTWNQCLRLSIGEYVICMGDDDKMLPHCLEEYDNLLKKYPGIGLLHGWTEIIDDQSSVIGLTTHRCEYETAMSLLWHRIYAYNSQFIGDFCFNASLLKNNGGFYKLPLAWASDDISAIIAAQAYGVANTQRVVFQYRRHPQTISNSHNEIIKMGAVNQKESWLKDYLSKPCIDPGDELYRLQLVKELPSLMSKERSLLVCDDISSHSFFRLFFWLRRRREFHLSSGAITRGFLKYIRDVFV